MKNHFLKNTYAAIFTLLIAMCALPQQAQAQTEYKLWICGTKVTSHNCDDLSNISGVSGTVKYDSNSKILTLENAKLTAEGNNNCIKSYIDGLTIEVSGNNELNATYSSININAPTTISGSGTLNAKSEQNYGILVFKTDLTIKNCTVSVKGRFGITGSDFPKENLLIKNATVTAEGERGSIRDFVSLTLEGCAITQPSGARFDESWCAVILNGQKVTDEVKIEPITEYDLKICGIKVNTANCNDLSVIDGVEGTVTYDPNNKILTLQNAKLNAEEINLCIDSQIDGLTIEVSGTNELNSTDAASICFNVRGTITGGGTLNINSQKHCGIYADESDLTIEDCIVNAKGRWGIAGEDNSIGQLFINNATVTAEGKDGSICDFSDLNLNGCYIAQPAGATFDPDMHCIVINGMLVNSKVVIKKISNGIEAPTIDTPTKQGIYTISGVKLNGEAKDLPKGIYIVNGKKVVKK